MRPIARQSTRLTNHVRSASCSRVRQQTAQRCGVNHYQARCFNACIPRPSEPRAPGDHEAWLAEQREQQRKAEAERDVKKEQAAEAGNGEVKSHGEGRRTMRDRTFRRRRHTDVPKPPPLPDWFLRHNVRLFEDRDKPSAAEGERQVMRCVDAETGHTLFTLPHYGLWPDDGSSAQTRNMTTLRNQEIDVTALGINAQFLSALPEAAREEVVTKVLIDQRAKKPGEVGLEALGELLVSLPRDLQEDVMRVEAVLRKRRGGGDDAPMKEPQLGLGSESCEVKRDQAVDQEKSIKIPQVPDKLLTTNFFSQRSPGDEVRPSSQPLPTVPKAPDFSKIVKTPAARKSLDVHTWAFLEAETSVRAAFAMAQDMQHMAPYTSSRVDLHLHCPDSNAHEHMDNLVVNLARSVQADVVDIIANDIEDLANEYVGQGRDEPGSFSTFGYEVYRGYVASNGPALLGAFGPPQDEHVDMQEDEVDEDEEEDDEARGSAGGSPRPGLMTIDQLRKTLHNKRHDLSKALSGIGVHSVTIVGGPPPGSAPTMSRPTRPVGASDYVRWDDERLGALLESIIDAWSEKTKRGEAVASPPNSADMPARKRTQLDVHPGLFKAQTAESLVAHLRDSNPLSQDASATKLEYQTMEIGAIRNAQPRSRCTIIHLRDLKDLYRSRLGSAVVQRLVQVVQKRRKLGEQIIVVGTTAQDYNNIFMTAPGNPEGFPFRNIIMPSPNSKHDSEVVPSVVPSLSRTFVHGGYSRILAVNLRHAQSTLRRLRPGQEVDLLSKGAISQMSLQGTHILADRILSQDRVQRLVLTAIGLASEHAKSDIVQPIHIALAADIAARVDHVALSFTSRDQNSAFPSRFAHGGSDGTAAKPAATSSRDSRKNKVDAIKPKCNQHEQRLLTGVADAENIKVGFSDVHATPETIDALKTLTTLSLMRPEAFSYGVLAADRLPGLLLYGPPGTGKTLLAKAVARESQATVLEVSGAQIYEKYVGEGEKMVRAVFSLAKKLSPCVVFIDEADAIFGSRSHPGNRNTHREIINQFLREWDGMDDHGIFMMVASNRPFDLDDAVLRRLPRRLLIDLPVVKDREAILGIHLKNEQLDSSVDLAKLADRTPFYSGSDLKNLAVSAALAAVREENDLAAANASNADFKLPEKRTLSSKHFEKAITEISASVSEDMASLTAIRKFDEQYGDRKGRRRKSSYGFGTSGAVVDESSVLVRQVSPQQAPPPGNQPSAPSPP